SPVYPKNEHPRNVALPGMMWAAIEEELPATNLMLSTSNEALLLTWNSIDAWVMVTIPGVADRRPEWVTFVGGMVMVTGFGPQLRTTSPPAATAAETAAPEQSVRTSAEEATATSVSGPRGPPPHPTRVAKRRMVRGRTPAARFNGRFMSDLLWERNGHGDLPVRPRAAGQQIPPDAGARQRSKCLHTLVNVAAFSAVAAEARLQRARAPAPGKCLTAACACAESAAAPAARSPACTALIVTGMSDV